MYTTEHLVHTCPARPEYYDDTQIEENEMGRTYSMYGRDKKCTQHFTLET
jgi:hypothetical protein